MHGVSPDAVEASLKRNPEGLCVTRTTPEDAMHGASISAQKKCTFCAWLSS